ncbi:ribbon-helix-helix protein, CopG family [[Clostridium] colinum]
MEREQTTIRLPVELKERLQQEALDRGISFNEIMIIALWKYLGEL